MSEDSLYRTERRIICLVPVKNEEWILDKFIRCTLEWADHLIIADQNSSDKSFDIASAYPKVTLIRNKSDAYAEDERQKLLLNEARKFPDEKILVALDADEIFSSGFANTQDWKDFLHSKPGTVGYFARAELLPGMRTYYGSEYKQAYAFVDDGAEHAGRQIHSPRVPIPKNALSFAIKDFAIMHFQNVNEMRMESKHRWYKCWERLKYPNKRTLPIMRLYDRYRATTLQNTCQVPDDWLKGYENIGISSLANETCNWFWWDDEVVSWIEKHGFTAFQKLNIWDKKWIKNLALNIRSCEQKDPHDPRSVLDKMIHAWVFATRKHPSMKLVRIIDRLFSLVGY
jgi:glycosyltransferase involved in cell wall biosynthesis